MKHLKKYWSIWVLCIILGVAAALRLYKLGSLPNGLYVDEVAIAVDAASIAKTGKDMHGGPWLTPIFPSYGDYKLPVYIWLASLSVKAFGATDFAVRLPSAIAGILTVLLVYAIAVELFEKETHARIIGLFSAAMVAMMPWSILFSRTAFEGHVGQMLLLASVFFALWARKKPWMYAVSAIIGAFAVYSYYSVRFVFPIVFALICLMQIKKKLWKTQLIWLGGCMLVFFLLLMPMTRSRYYNQMQLIRLSTKSVLDPTNFVERANTLRAIAGDSLISHVMYHRTIFMTEELARHYSDYVNFSYLFVSGDSNLRHSTQETGILLFGMLPLLILGLISLVHKHKKAALLFFVWYVVAILPAAVPYNTPHSLRSLNALGLMGIVLGLGAHELLVQAKHTMTWRVIGVATLLFLMLNFFSFWHDYTRLYPERSEGAWAQSRKILGMFIQQKKTDYKTISIVGDDHLFMWVAWYGGYDIQQVQSAPSVRFIKPAFGNVRFLGEVPEKGLQEGKGQKELLIAHDGELKQYDGVSIIAAPSESFSYVETK